MKELQQGNGIMSATELPRVDDGAWIRTILKVVLLPIFALVWVLLFLAVVIGVSGARK